MIILQKETLSCSWPILPPARRWFLIALDMPPFPLCPAAVYLFSVIAQPLAHNTQIQPVEFARCYHLTPPDSPVVDIGTHKPIPGALAQDHGPNRQYLLVLQLCPELIPIPFIARLCICYQRIAQQFVIGVFFQFPFIALQNPAHRRRRLLFGNHQGRQL